MTGAARAFIAATFSACVIVAQLATAGPLEDADAAYERADYATALRLSRPMADLGDAKAEYNLGVMYDKGEGVPQDHAEAARWYRKAAEQGNASAEYELGMMYYSVRACHRTIPRR